MTEDNRLEPRSMDLGTYRVEIKFVGKPIYQFKVRDLSRRGAGILIKADSEFLKMIEVDQILDVNLIPPKGLGPSGMHVAEIKHVTRLEAGRFSGHQLVGISILERLSQI